MAWFALALVFLVAFVAVVAFAVKGRAELDSRADLDQLKRTDPDHPLANISQSEYDRALAEVRNSKAQKGCVPLLVMFAGIIIVGPIAAWLAYGATDSGFVALFVWLAPSLAGMFFFFRVGGKATAKPTHDEIARHLGL